RVRASHGAYSAGGSSLCSRKRLATSSHSGLSASRVWERCSSLSSIRITPGDRSAAALRGAIDSPRGESTRRAVREPLAGQELVRLRARRVQGTGDELALVHPVAVLLPLERLHPPVRLARGREVDGHRLAHHGELVVALEVLVGGDERVHGEGGV